jgi:hypothetical protein
MTVHRSRSRSVAVAAVFGSLALAGTAFLTVPTHASTPVPASAVVVGDLGSSATQPGFPDPAAVRPL